MCTRENSAAFQFYGRSTQLAPGKPRNFHFFSLALLAPNTEKSQPYKPAPSQARNLATPNIRTQSRHGRPPRKKKFDCPALAVSLKPLCQVSTSMQRTSLVALDTRIILLRTPDGGEAGLAKFRSDYLFGCPDSGDRGGRARKAPCWYGSSTYFRGANPLGRESGRNHDLRASPTWTRQGCLRAARGPDPLADLEVETDGAEGPPRSTEQDTRPKPPVFPDQLGEAPRKLEALLTAERRAPGRCGNLSSSQFPLAKVPRVSLPQLAFCLVA